MELTYIRTRTNFQDGGGQVTIFGSSTGRQQIGWVGSGDENRMKVLNGTIMSSH